MTIGHLYIGIFFILGYFLLFGIVHVVHKRTKHWHNQPTDVKSSFSLFNRADAIQIGTTPAMILGGGIVLILVYLVDYFNLYSWFSWWLALFSV